MTETGNGRTLEQRVRSVLEGRAEIAFAYLFGSRAFGRTHGASDVDVAVYLREDELSTHREPGADGGDGGRSEDGERARSAGRGGSGSWSAELAAWSEIHGGLVAALASAVSAGGGSQGGHAPEGVDLVILNDAPPLLADRVLRSGQLVVSRSEAERIRWMVRTKSRYCDLQPLRRRLDDTVSERLRTGRFGRPAPKRRFDHDRAGREASSDATTNEGRPGIANIATVRRRLRKLDELVQRLRELRRIPRAEFLQDSRAQAAAERWLQAAIQLCLDVGADVLRDRGIIDWEEYREVPQRLAEEEVLSQELSDRLSRAAGQRNILVHLYLEVDPEKVHDTLVHELDVFVAFAGRMEKLLEEGQGTVSG